MDRAVMLGHKLMDLFVLLEIPDADCLARDPGNGISAVRIRFDYNLAKGQQMWLYGLESTIIDQDPQPLKWKDADKLGFRTYAFKYDSAHVNCVDLLYQKRNGDRFELV